MPSPNPTISTVKTGPAGAALKITAEADGNPRRTRATATRVPQRWTAGQRSAVEDYLLELISILRLRDWHLELDWSRPADDDCYASITPYPDSRRAVVRIGELFLHLDADEQRSTLVHELAHCHLFALHHLADRILQVALCEPAQAVAETALQAEIECTTDALADVLAPMCPVFRFPAG